MESQSSLHGELRSRYIDYTFHLRAEKRFKSLSRLRLPRPDIWSYCYSTVGGTEHGTSNLTGRCYILQIRILFADLI